MKSRTSKRIVLATAAALAGLAIAGPSPRSIAGDLLWAEAVHVINGDTQLRASALQGGVVYAVGDIDASRNFDALVCAYDVRTGSPLWQERYDRAGNDDRALDVAVTNGRVHVVGMDTDASGNTDYSVRTFDRLGQLLWEDHHDPAGLDDVAIAACTSSGHVFTAGRVERRPGNSDFVVRAYTAAKGKLLWQDRVDWAGQFDNASCISALDGLVVAGGYLTNPAGDADFFVRAYAANTGLVLWEDLVDGLGPRGDLVNAVVVHGDMVFAAGRLAVPAGDLEFLVRAYDSATGALLWEDVYDLTGNDDVATDITALCGRVFAVGVATPANLLDDMIVRAYACDTGRPLWTDQYDQASGLDSAETVAARGETVFVGGVSDNAAGDGDILVRAYDDATGMLLWADLHDHVGGTDAVRDVVAGGGRAFAIGSAQQDVFPSSPRDGAVRAYDGW